MCFTAAVAAAAAAAAAAVTSGPTTDNKGPDHMSISSLEPRKLGSEVFAHAPTHRPPRHPQRPPRTHTIEGDHLRLPSKPHPLNPLRTGTGAPQSQGLDWTVSPPLEVPEFSLLRDTVGERGALSVSRCAV